MTRTAFDAVAQIDQVAEPTRWSRGNGEALSLGDPLRKRFSQTSKKYVRTFAQSGRKLCDVVRKGTQCQGRLCINAQLGAYK